MLSLIHTFLKWSTESLRERDRKKTCNKKKLEPLSTKNRFWWTSWHLRFQTNSYYFVENTWPFYREFYFLKIKIKIVLFSTMNALTSERAKRKNWSVLYMLLLLKRIFKVSGKLLNIPIECARQMWCYSKKKTTENNNNNKIFDFYRALI